MDIRKWLTSAKTINSKTNGSDEIDVKSKRKSFSPKKDTKVKKKRRVIESDSDEEPVPKEKPELKVDKGLKKESKNPDEKKKPVSISTFFGSAPVVRSDKNKADHAKKAEPESIHEDPDFEATLQKLNSKPLKIPPENETANKYAKEEKKVKSSDKIESRVKSPPKKKFVKEENKVKSPPKEKFIKEENKYKSPSTEKFVKDETKVKASPKDKTENKPKSRKKSSNMEFEAAPKARKTVIVDDPKPPPKKHKGSTGYASYLGREGPKALGSKEIPEGEDDCLAGLTFIITGVLESIERDDAKSLIERYGGKLMSTISKNTKYMVIGRDAGASKLEKAEKLGTKQIDEDGLFDLIRTLPGKKGSKKPSKKTELSIKVEPKELELDDFNDDFEIEMAQVVDSAFEVKPNLVLTKSSKKLDEDSSSKSEVKLEKDHVKVKEEPEETTVHKVKLEKDHVKIKEEPEETAVHKKIDRKGIFNVNMWVDKYKPTSMKQVIGQQGDKSNAKKLLDWLKNWKKNRLLGKKPVFAGRWNATDDGSGHKAALLSGPPGVGKTTTAQLVCKEAGFDYFELNASDTRSKKYLQQSVSQLLGNQTLGDCFNGDTSGKVSSKHVVIMDEVDGMAGNEDRGGMRELIDFIKASKIPIICICNDRNHTKIRSLANYCFDLRFQRPRVEQIKAAMLSVAFKEGIKVSPEALQDVIIASNQDIRQVLHNMSMWSAKAKNMTADQTKLDVGKGTKHIKMGPFDVLREVFAIGLKPNASIMDKSDLFFHDYSIAPLFVHENYIHVIPTAAEGNKKKHLTLLSEAADSICIGDIIDRQIRSNSSWSLLPTQAIFASVVPGELLQGHLRQMISFPAWLGKNSNKNHMDRVLQELHIHMRMRITGNKTDVALEYLPLLKHALTKPLIEKEQNGIPDVLKIMEQYFLLREDFDSIIDLSLWPGQTDPRSKINTKTKSAFTRTYNKECGKNPYSVTNVKKKKSSAADLEIVDEDEVNEEEEEVEDDSIENDAMIKVKKPSKKNASASEASTSKEKKKGAPKKGKSK